MIGQQRQTVRAWVPDAVKQTRALETLAQKLECTPDLRKELAHLRAFKKPEILQTQSAFMSKFGRVPEIRLQIFQYLVSSNNPLADKNFQFTPNVLRACQTWYREAADILYHENTVLVGIKLFWTGINPIITILDTHYGPNKQEPHGAYGLEPAALPVGIRQYSEKFLLQVTQCSDVEAEVLYDTLPQACRGLIPLLFRKHVTIQIMSMEKWPCVDIEKALDNHLPAFHLLRCQSVAFDYTPQLPDSGLGSTLALVRQVMTSNTPPVDTLMELDLLKAYLVEMRRRFFTNAKTKEGRAFRSNMHEMEESARKWDVAEFRRLGQELVTEAWTKEMRVATPRKDALRVMRWLQL